MAGVEMAASIARFTADQLDEAQAAMRRDGVVVFDNLWSEQRMAELNAAMAQHYPAYVATDEDIPGDHSDVGDRRFVAPITFAAPFDCADVLLHPALSALFATLLTDQFVIEAMGVICARPGAEAQHIHRDNPPMFPGEGLDRILPSAALAMYCPLVAVVGDNGSTGFWPGSHRRDGDLVEDQFVTADLPLGSCIVWDLRTYHQGRPYSTGPARIVLYETVCRPFWIDQVNFVPGKNAKLLASQAALDQLDKKQRKRFVRAEVTA
jgi:Phytanoyl-CoA dioxygenase (PhyH)